MSSTLAPFLGLEGEEERREQAELARREGALPLPSSVSQYKGHPLYVLARHLLKFEAIYPPDAPTLGFIKGETPCSVDHVELAV